MSKAKKEIKKSSSLSNISEPELFYHLEDGGEILLIKNFIPNTDSLFDELLANIKWKKFKYVVYNREVESPRYMNIINFDNGSCPQILPQLCLLKKYIEERFKMNFSYAVLNYYRDGKDYIGFHSDGETKKDTSIVSFSIGATRRFVLKHKYKPDIKYIFSLEDGDLMLLNYQAIKTKYKHSIPKMANAEKRISITFRV